MSIEADAVARRYALQDMNVARWMSRLRLLGPITDSVSLSDIIALGLLYWMLAMVGWSVLLAGWGDLPNIIPTLLMGATAAFIVSKANINVLLKITAFLVSGVAIVFWQGSLPADGAHVVEKSVDAWNRFALWIDIAVNGGVSGDSVPFSMLFMTASWVVSYAVSALTFRFRSPWIPALMLGVGLLTNLSHRQGLHEHTFYLFMVGAIAQFAHLVALRRLHQWREADLSVPREAMWIAARDGLLLGVAVILISASAPLYEPRSETLRGAWNAVFLDPLSSFKSTAERLLAGIPSGDDGLLDTPNSVMPFRGGIELTDDPIMWIRSRYAKLHPGRVYQEYTSSGWVSAPSVSVEASSNSQLSERPIDSGVESRDLIQMTVQLAGGTDLVIPAAAVHTIDYSANVEILEPLAWDVPLVGDARRIAEMPEDLREMAFALRFRLADIATENAPGSQFTVENHPPHDVAVVDEAINEIRAATDNFLDEDEPLPVEIYVTIDGREASDFRPFNGSRFQQVSSLDELVEIQNGENEAAFSISLNQLAEFKIEAERRDLRSVMSLIEGLDELLRNPGVPVDSSIDWDSFSYNIFTEPDTTNALFMRIVRNAPPEQNTVTFAETLKENQQYQVSTYVSTADDEELAQSGADYPHWVTDRYLQIPVTMPPRIIRLARQIVSDADAETPWEKTQAIKKFLQSQVYSLEINGPGPFEDGLDYFLFQTANEPCPSTSPNCDANRIKGYSQYYGSAGTMLLRSVGVPARMIAGWGIGEYLPDQGQFIIRDRNRHGWTQAYMPPYGWIDVEVTPGKPAVPRNVRVPTVPLSDIPPEVVGSAEFDPDFMEDLEYLDSLALEARAFLSRQQSQQPENNNLFSLTVPSIAVAAIAVVLPIVLALVVAWRWNLRGKPPAVRAYMQFARIAALAGYRRASHHSAREFAEHLEGLSPTFRRDSQALVESYERSVYGSEPISDGASGKNEQDARKDEADDVRELNRAWRRMSLALATYRIGRIFGLKPPLYRETL